MVITAVVIEGRTPADVIAEYGGSKSWLYELLTRYKLEGDAAFEPRSRRPHTSPTATPDTVVDLIVGLRKELSGSGLDAGPDTIAWHLAHRHEITVSLATISRTLTRQGLVVPEPKKRPKTSYIRFQAAMPNETWQSDFTHYRLTRPGDPEPRTGPDCEVITWLDDHSRYALHISAHVRVSGPIVLATFRETAGQHGYPASTLTDNGLVYTARFAGGPGGRTSLEHELKRLDIVQKNSRPNHPTTCGKVERFQQTMKKWLRAQPVQPTTLAELQALLEAFADEYNHRRPHRSLPQRSTPATAYQARPKATPSADRSNDSHQRVRTDRLDQSGCVTLRVNGRLHHIGVGRTHARTHILLLVQDLYVRIVDAATGELLRELTINPDKDYQGTGRPPGPPPGRRRK